MTEIFLNDKEVSNQLFPFAVTRHVSDIRVGIFTIREKWANLLQATILPLGEDTGTANGKVIFAANIIPSRAFAASLKNGASGLSKDPDWQSVKLLQYPWHICAWNDWALREDFEWIRKSQKSQPVPASVQAINSKDIFIEEGARISYCSLNASAGPIYIGRNAEIMEGALIRGPFALCEGAVVKMGARIYGATTIGPYCVAGGEIKNAVLFGYSNKAHDGYLGDSVIGEWCNLGAGTTNSNVKNNAAEIKVWNQASRDYVTAGTKCGLLMGDYSRSAINTAFNTGTVVGICSNVFGAGLTPKFIPSFSWGTQTLSRYEFEKAIADINNWMLLKGQKLSEAQTIRLRTIFELS
jgi:UDP-N-acetylglucosamine diphosphorylase/glucosamine-1-phosphate N-acetyltransferase